MDEACREKTVGLFCLAVVAAVLWMSASVQGQGVARLSAQMRGRNLDSGAAGDSSAVLASQRLSGSSERLERASVFDGLPSGTGARGHQGAQRLASSSDLSNLPPYQLGPGDMVEIIYQLTNQKRSEPYRVDIADELDIVFQYTPQFNAKVTVRTDGKIEMPIIGEFDTYGKTVAQVDDELTSCLSAVLKDPEISVRLVKSNGAVEELKKAITTSPRGQSRAVSVAPDGFISLPLIGEIRAAGLSPGDLARQIVGRYRDVRILDVDITVDLLETRSPVAYVTGDVVSPGPVVLQGPTDVWRLISNVGGFVSTADQSHVIVAKACGGAEQRLVLNYRRWLESTDPRNNTAIGRGDVVYVPRNSDTFVYVAGEVEKPGPIAVLADQPLTVVQAVATAGGIRDRGNECQVLILRRSFFGRPVVVEVPYGALINPASYRGPNGAPAEDTPLKPGDIVFVSRTRVGDFNRFAKTWFRDGIWTILPFGVSADYRLQGGSSR